MNGNDRDLAHYSEVLALVRAHASRHARRHMVLCDSHVPSGGLVREGRLLWTSTRSRSGSRRSPTGRRRPSWSRDSPTASTAGARAGRRPAAGRASTCPTWWRSTTGARAGTRGSPGKEASGSGDTTRSPGSHTRPEEYRDGWLRYAWDWVRKTDPAGHLQMPGSRTLRSPLDGKRWYFANRRSRGGPGRAGRRGGDPGDLGFRIGAVRAIAKVPGVS